MCKLERIVLTECVRLSVCERECYSVCMCLCVFDRKRSKCLRRSIYIYGERESEAIHLRECSLVCERERKRSFV